MITEEMVAVGDALAVYQSLLSRYVRCVLLNGHRRIICPLKIVFDSMVIHLKASRYGPAF